jgi:hypothetical protein
VTPNAETRTELEVKETLVDALAMETLGSLFSNAMEARRHELAIERRTMKQQMEGQEDARAAEWLQGIDELSSGSLDLLTAMVYIPA